MSALFRPAIRILIVGALLSGALIWAAVTHITAVASGTEIVLQAHGYDPRGLLTGHYTQVRYTINSGEGLRRLKGEDRREFPVWVTIKPSFNDWIVTGVSRAKPQALAHGEHAVAAYARFLYVATDEDIVNYDLRYGIERIYAQQSEAEALAKLMQTRLDQGVEPRLQVVSSLGRDGKLRIKGLIAEGVRKDFAWW